MDVRETNFDQGRLNSIIGLRAKQCTETPTYTTTQKCKCR